MGVRIVGASGAGTTTLGQALEREYGYKWLDTDGFFGEQTDPPFLKSLPHEERVKLMSVAMQEHTPTDIRIKRLEKRESERFGSRIRKGGDMYDNHLDFIEWAKGYDDSTNGRAVNCMKNG